MAPRSLVELRLPSYMCRDEKSSPIPSKTPFLTVSAGGGDVICHVLAAYTLALYALTKVGYNIPVSPTNLLTIFDRLYTEQATKQPRQSDKVIIFFWRSFPSHDRLTTYTDSDTSISGK